jgi:hypothetical protein
VEAKVRKQARMRRVFMDAPEKKCRYGEEAKPMRRGRQSVVPII